MREHIAPVRTGVICLIACGVVSCSTLGPRMSDRSGNVAINASAAAVAASVDRRSAASLLPEIALPRTGTLLMIGDSVTLGYQAVPGISLASLTAALLGWKSTTIYASGYTTPDSVTRQFAQQTALRARPDLILVEEGFNDRKASAGQEADGVRQGVAGIRSRFPSAPIVLIGPIAPYTSPDPVWVNLDNEIAQEASALGIHYISPTAEHWISASAASRIIGVSDSKPFFTLVGQQYLAARLLADLRLISSMP